MDFKGSAFDGVQGAKPLALFFRTLERRVDHCRIAMRTLDDIDAPADFAGQVARFAREQSDALVALDAVRPELRLFVIPGGK